MLALSCENTITFYPGMYAIQKIYKQKRKLHTVSVKRNPALAHKTQSTHCMRTNRRAAWKERSAGAGARAPPPPLHNNGCQFTIYHTVYERTIQSFTVINSGFRTRKYTLGVAFSARWYRYIYKNPNALERKRAF